MRVLLNACNQKMQDRGAGCRGGHSSKQSSLTCFPGLRRFSDLDPIDTWQIHIIITPLSQRRLPDILRATRHKVWVGSETWGSEVFSKPLVGIGDHSGFLACRHELSRLKKHKPKTISYFKGGYLGPLMT
jgi:hypothetical protein